MPAKIDDSSMMKMFDAFVRMFRTCFNRLSKEASMKIRRTWMFCRSHRPHQQADSCLDRNVSAWSESWSVEIN